MIYIQLCQILNTYIWFIIIYLFKNEIHDGSSDREDQRWNNSSDDDDDGGCGGAEYSWQGINDKNKSTSQTNGKL